ncbi:MAG: efflux RND transporter periplasmic adaptor subunit [Planctomycetes bacterium]|nr:efflux RND transporter periplasmic adaptor subunit [Planctomycetota bacterium]
MKLSPGLKSAFAWILSTVVLVALGLHLTGVFEERIPADSHPSAPRIPVEGAAFRVQSVEGRLIERSPGTLRAIRETAIVSRIVAEVREVLVTAGERVATGDTLALLDDRDLQAVLRQSEDELTGAQARLRESEAAHSRTLAAAEKSAVAQSTLDQAEAAKLSAESEVARITQRIEQARVDLSHATIVAPFDAVVIDRYAYPGDLASPERPLLRLYDPGRMRLEAYVRESLAIHLAVGQKVQVELEALDSLVEGTVEEVVPQAESASRSFLVKVSVPAADKLYPGMYGKLLLDAGVATRLMIPESALTHVGQLSYVTLADDRATRRLVVTGSVDGDGMVEVLSGLESGAEVRVPR